MALDSILKIKIFEQSDDTRTLRGDWIQTKALWFLQAEGGRAYIIRLMVSRTKQASVVNFTTLRIFIAGSGTDRWLYYPLLVNLCPDFITLVSIQWVELSSRFVNEFGGITSSQWSFRWFIIFIYLFLNAFRISNLSPRIYLYSPFPKYLIIIILWFFKYWDIYLNTII